MSDLCDPRVGEMPSVRRSHTMSERIIVSIEDDVAVVQIDNPPVNALTAEVVDGLQSAIRDAERVGRRAQRL